jgi:hypothetical protein
VSSTIHRVGGGKENLDFLGSRSSDGLFVGFLAGSRGFAVLFLQSQVSVPSPPRQQSACACYPSGPHTSSPRQSKRDGALLTVSPPARNSSTVICESTRGRLSDLLVPPRQAWGKTGSGSGRSRKLAPVTKVGMDPGGCKDGNPGGHLSVAVPVHPGSPGKRARREDQEPKEKQQHRGSRQHSSSGSLPGMARFSRGEVDVQPLCDLCTGWFFRCRGTEERRIVGLWEGEAPVFEVVKRAEPSRI